MKGIRAAFFCAVSRACAAYHNIMSKMLLTVSGKGGTGKSSFCAGVGCALASCGSKTLIIDADAGARNLDLVLGMTDRSLFSFEDVCKNRIEFNQAAAQSGTLSELYLLAAPSLSALSGVSPCEIGALVRMARSEFDWIIVDCAAGFGSEISLFAAFCDCAAVVSTCDSISLRCAEKSASYLADVCRVPDDRIKLVVNRVSPRAAKSLNKNIDDAIDQSGLPLLGVIPEDRSVPRCAEKGQLPIAKRGAACCAFRRIARRLCGEYVPLGVR